MISIPQTLLPLESLPLPLIAVIMCEVLLNKAIKTLGEGWEGGYFCKYLSYGVIESASKSNRHSFFQRQALQPEPLQPDGGGGRQAHRLDRGGGRPDDQHDGDGGGGAAGGAERGSSGTGERGDGVGAVVAGPRHRHAQAAHARVQRVRGAEAGRGQRVLQAPLRPHRRTRLLRRPRLGGEFILSHTHYDLNGTLEFLRSHPQSQIANSKLQYSILHVAEL